MNLNTITTQLSIITERITLIMNENDRLKVELRSISKKYEDCKIECEVLKSNVEEMEEWAEIEVNNIAVERDELAAQLDAALTELSNIT
jgi:archaellum component FlaC